MKTIIYRVDLDSRPGYYPGVDDLVEMIFNPETKRVEKQAARYYLSQISIMICCVLKGQDYVERSISKKNAYGRQERIDKGKANE